MHEPVRTVTNITLFIPFVTVGWETQQYACDNAKRLNTEGLFKCADVSDAVENRLRRHRRAGVESRYKRDDVFVHSPSEKKHKRIT